MSVIIFDFDGTIADSRDYIIDFIAKEAGKKLSRTEVKALYGQSMVKTARSLGVEWWYMPSLFFKGRSLMRGSLKRIKPFNGMLDTVKKLHAEGHELFIVSSNSLTNIRLFLKRYRLREYFMEVYAGIEVFGKAPIFKSLINEHNLSAHNTVSIGDEIRDIEAAKEIGLRTIAVTWGFASINDLTNLHPTAIAHNPKEIIYIMEEL